MNDKINIKRPSQILDYVDTKEHLVDLFNYINQLQSNWNSLREYCKEYADKDTMSSIIFGVVLDKMNELESSDGN